MHNTLRTTILLAALTGLIVGLGQMLGGTNGALLALVVAAVMNIGSYWFSDRIRGTTHRGSASAGPLPDGQAAHDQGQHSHASHLSDPGRHAERVRDRP